MVLVCGDAPQDGEWIADLVSTLGYTALRASTVDQALAQVGDARPDAIVIPLLDDAQHWVAGLAAPSESHGIPVIAVGPGDGGEGLLESLHDVLPGMRPGTVLVVEDDPALGEVLTQALSEDGAQPRLVRTAREAADAIRSTAPSVVILDLVLPDKDGFSVVEELRGEGLLSEVPLLVYTALDLSAGDRERLQVGHTEFHAKGVASPQDLRRRVAELLGRVVEGRGPGR